MLRKRQARGRSQLPTPDPDLEAAPPLQAKGKAARHNDRKCIATGAALGPRDPAIRFVAAPDKSVVADLAGKLPGRGAWVSAQSEAVMRAAEKGLFARAFKVQVTLPEGQDAAAFVAHIEGALRQRALGALGLVRRAGGMIQGFEKLRESIKKGEVHAYLYATDGAADGRDKLLKLVAAVPHRCVMIGIFSGEELDQALGSHNIVHLGLTKPGMSKVFLYEAQRLAGFLPNTGFIPNEGFLPNIPAQAEFKTPD